MAAKWRFYINFRSNEERIDGHVLEKWNLKGNLRRFRLIGPRGVEPRVHGKTASKLPWMEPAPARPHVRPSTLVVTCMWSVS